MKNVVKLLSILLLASGVGFMSCDKDPVKVTGVTLSGESSLTLEVGGDVTLKATVAPSDAKDNTVKWESSDDEVATVDNNGKVKAVGVGRATITVRTTDGGFTAQCKITVEPKIEDNFQIVLEAAFYNGSNKVTANTVTFTGCSDPIQNGSISWRFLVTIENTSGKIIPKGTPYKFRLKINDKPYQFQGGDLVSGVLDADISVGGIAAIISWNSFPILADYNHIGDNHTCGELIQLGKKDYSTPISDCVFYTLVEGEEGGSAATNVVIK